MKDYKECQCGVPNFLHNTCCGWENASPILLSPNDTLNCTGEEKKKRWELLKPFVIDVISIIRFIRESGFKTSVNDDGRTPSYYWYKDKIVGLYDDNEIYEEYLKSK